MGGRGAHADTACVADSILGSGLTAVDVICALTVGRGGTFRKVNEELVYQPSGEEPRMVLVSEHGWLPCTRPSLPRGSPPPESGLLTRAAIAELRQRVGNGRIDYRRDLEPLLHAELKGDDLGAEERRTIDRVLGAGEQTSSTPLAGWRPAC